MDNLIEKKFEEIGARVNVHEITSNFVNDPSPRIRVNVTNDNKGQIFDIGVRGKIELSIPDLRPDDRHLVLLAKIFDSNNPHIEPTKAKFLCGHDEREWFSSQLPNTGITTVDTAKLALAPKPIIEQQEKKGLKLKDRVKRKNEVSLRQGEWFFVPVNIEDPDPAIILRNEPLRVSNSRGGNKPHIAQFAFRTGGTVVYVPQLPVQMMLDNNIDRERLGAGLTEREKKKYLRENPRAKSWNWTHQIRNPKFYVKGTVRHPDHATLKLRQWHRVHMNEEVRGRFNVFLD